MTPQNSHIILFNPPTIRAPRPSYSQVASTIISPGSHLITTSGQVGTTVTGETPTSFAAQAKLVFQNLHVCLHTAGARIQDIVKLTYYIIDAGNHHAEFSPALMEFLTDEKGNVHRPPATMVEVKALARKDWLLEVEAVAVVSPPPSLSTLTLSSPPEIRLVDVVVVGAGLSGLQAALDIQKAGLSCAILEARDRVGGKTLSRPLASGKGVVDIGAAWLNNKTQPRIHELAMKYGFETVVQRTDGDQVIELKPGESHRYGSGAIPPASKRALEDMRRIQVTLEEEAAKIDVHHLPRSDFDNETVAQFLRRNEVDKVAYEVIETTIKGLLGVDATELSLYYYLDYIKSGGSLADLRSDKSNGAQYMLVKTGMQSISKAMATDLELGSLFLSSPVTAITKTSSTANTITTSSGLQFNAKKIIISIPTPLYRTITFSPPLSASKATLADSTTLGYYAKTILIYSSPWWRASEINLNGSFTSLTGHVSFTRDTSVPSDSQYSLTCFIVGGTGRSWSILSPIKRRQAVLDQIAGMVEEEHRRKVYDTEEIIEQEWIKEQWSQGAPCPVMEPGLLNRYADVLRRRCGDVHFVGTETAFEWKGYMEGAVRAGERGAMEVIEALKGE
ncbi:putative flavin-containing amine oxidase [Mollisia scopiformis]|uniref:Amine oxidase n=1 Tax=Mollisia scopiformis TaxID=149040 RepID=A0A194XUV5_MOLSC|nr:putative flavin-containing amine oxidase [Mollisia scopiformis]KUJ23819.1 putative flavin-containing amine oxidase [Mollisia scopiformis]